MSGGSSFPLRCYCVPMPNGITRLLFQRTDGMSADFCRPDRSAKTTKDGRSCPHFSRLSPAGVPVGRRAASRRPEINITETRVVIRRHGENKNHGSMWSSTPIEFGNVVCLNENETKNGSFFGTVKAVPYSVSEHRQGI